MQILEILTTPIFSLATNFMNHLPAKRKELVCFQSFSSDYHKWSVREYPSRYLCWYPLSVGRVFSSSTWDCRTSPLWARPLGTYTSGYLLHVSHCSAFKCPDGRVSCKYVFSLPFRQCICDNGQFSPVPKYLVVIIYIYRLRVYSCSFQAG